MEEEAHQQVAHREAVAHAEDTLSSRQSQRSTLPEPSDLFIIEVPLRLILSPLKKRASPANSPYPNPSFASSTQSPTDLRCSFPRPE